MSGSSPPPDNSMAIRQMELDDAKRQQEANDAKAEAHKTELGNLRTNARQAAGGNVNQFFSAQGVDPASYTNDINSFLDNILAGVNPTDENPALAFKDAGQSIYSNVESGRRARANTDLDRMFAPSFETKRIPFTLDDPYLDSIQAEQRSTADKMIKNMLDRGVITQSGYGAASADLDKQAAGVKSQLNEIGTTTLAGGQQKLKDVANQARQDASTLRVGQAFDPTSYSADADQVFNDFINNLGTSIRSKVTGNMFNTTGLAALAGAAQGAGNTAFNPAAAQGVITDENEDDNKDKTKESIF